MHDRWFESQSLNKVKIPENRLNLFSKNGICNVYKL